ncbi:MAG: UDP-N-acetylmuramate--L-alanine ligase [Actinomycetota bacterium]|nr:UDP-N-acetylmuramate--L-alanine ligase [Actinomycetota bacterium]
MFEPPTVPLDGIDSIHMIGVGGSGMSGLAKLLAQRGIRVTGSDVKPSSVIDALSEIGVETWIGHRPDRISDVDVVVASSAVPDRDPELQSARDSGVVTERRPALLRGVTVEYPTIGFSGTHGKTSSTAMAVAALRACGKDPSFIVGGEIADLNTGAHLGDPDLLLLEADEAFGTFRLLELAGLDVTNIEADHLDYYRTVTALEEAFAQVSNRVDGPVVGCIDDPGVRRLAERSTVIGYGTSDDASWKIDDVALDARPSFSFTGRGLTRRVRLNQPGMHVIRNAAGVLALLGELGFDLDCAIGGLETSGGVRRRFEVKVEIDEISIIDDYAHHPTEVRSTIAAARTMTSGRLWVVFQPHRYTRTAALAPAFGAPLAEADRVVVTDIYSAGERPQPGVTGRLVDEAVRASGGDATYVEHLAEVPDYLAGELEAGDTLVLMGAGDVATIWAQIADRVGDRS